LSKYTSRNIGSKKNTFDTRRKVGIALLAISLVVLFFSAFNVVPFLNNFFLGSFGLAIFPVILVAFIIAIALLLKKRYVFSKRYVISLVGAYLCLILILQIALTAISGTGFTSYVASVYVDKITPGGVLMGLIAYGLVVCITSVGAYIVSAILLVVCGVFIWDYFNTIKGYRKIESRTVSLPDFDVDNVNMHDNGSRANYDEAYETSEQQAVQKEQVPLTLNAKMEKSARDLAKEKLGMAEKVTVEQMRSISPESQEKSSIFSEEFIKTVKSTNRNGIKSSEAKQENNYSLFDLIKKNEQTRAMPTATPTSTDGRPPKFVHEETARRAETPPSFVVPKMDEAVRRDINNFANSSPAHPQASHEQQAHYTSRTPEPSSVTYSQKSTAPQQFTPRAPEPYQEQSKPQQPINSGVASFTNSNVQLNPTPSPINTPPTNTSSAHIVNPRDLDADIDEILSPTKTGVDFNTTHSLDENRRDFNRPRNVPTTNNRNTHSPQKQPNNNQRNNSMQMKMPETENNKNKNVTKYTRPSAYVRPPIELLTTVSTRSDEDADDYQTKALILEQTLENFKIPAKVKAITHGPAVTRYELQMPPGIPVKRIAQHADDIAMTLEASGAVRIEAPIPGKGLVGIEVPNANIATIGLHDIIDSQEFLSNKAPLVFALGKDIAGTIKVCDLNSMPHLLVAGSTGSGKSVCLNAIILSFLYKLSPEELKIILIDPKRVEFTTYSRLPHMILPDAITDPEQALNALNWAIKEMERRYETFASRRVRDFKEYNALEEVYNGTEPKLPRIVIIVDELADLMMTAKRDMEDKIKRLAQLARAAGMHLIIATQRPSVDVITGTIKSNLPSRIAFAVTNFADSKTILDGGGADKLLGKGDMLYAPQNLPEPIRVQGAFVSNSEVNDVCNFIKAHNASSFDDEMNDLILNGEKQPVIEGSNSSEGGADYDPLLPQALKQFMESGQGSISMIQRRYSVGFARAARIVDQMELAGYISPSDGSNKNRSVLITPEKYEELFGSDEPMI